MGKSVNHISLNALIGSIMSNKEEQQRINKQEGQQQERTREKENC